jgi:hypothetical protein
MGRKGGEKSEIKLPAVSSFCNLFFFFFCSTGVWTQDLHLEPLHQPYFCEGFFEIGSHRTICQGWLWTAIFLISASWVAKITGVSHWRPAIFFFLQNSEPSIYFYDVWLLLFFVSSFLVLGSNPRPHTFEASAPPSYIPAHIMYDYNHGFLSLSLLFWCWDGNPGPCAC